MGKKFTDPVIYVQALNLASSPTDQKNPTSQKKRKKSPTPPKFTLKGLRKGVGN